MRSSVCDYFARRSATTSAGARSGTSAGGRPATSRRPVYPARFTAIAC